MVSNETKIVTILGCIAMIALFSMILLDNSGGKKVNCFDNKGSIILDLTCKTPEQKLSDKLIIISALGAIFFLVVWACWKFDEVVNG